MSSTRRVNIFHQDFNSFTGSAFEILYSDQYFTDVTLVCDEDKQLNAHKFILSSCSILFRRILMKNPHQHPLIYLNGIDFKNLQAILQFIYLGQIEIAHDTLKQFIETARELEINGLAGLEYESNDQTNSDKALAQIAEVTYESEKEFLKDEYNHSSANISLPTEEEYLVSEDNDPDAEVITQTIKLNCDQCEQCFPGKNSLKKHIRTIHDGLTYPLTNADRAKMYRERRKMILPEDDLKEMTRIINKRKVAKLQARRCEDKDFDEIVLQKNRERVRRFREKKALEAALARKVV